MNNKTDLRIVRTENALLMSLFSLMQEKNFDDITVNEICDRAMIRRATFYKHYQDKYDFYGHCISTFFESFDYNKPGHIPSQDPVENYTYSVGLVLEFISSNQNIIRSIMRSNMSSLLLSISTDQISKSISVQIEKDIASGLLNGIDLEVAVAVLTGAFLSLLDVWIENKNKISKEEMLRNVDALIRRIYV